MLLLGPDIFGKVGSAAAQESGSPPCLAAGGARPHPFHRNQQMCEKRSLVLVGHVFFFRTISEETAAV